MAPALSPPAVSLSIPPKRPALGPLVPAAMGFLLPVPGGSQRLGTMAKGLVLTCGLPIKNNARGPSLAATTLPSISLMTGEASRQ